MRQSFRCRPIFAVMKAVMQSQYYPSTKLTPIHPPCSILGCIKGIFLHERGGGFSPSPFLQSKNTLYNISHLVGGPPLRGVGRPVKLGAPKGNFHIWLKFGVRVQIFLKVEDFDIIFIVKNVICYK